MVGSAPQAQPQSRVARQEAPPCGAETLAAHSIHPRAEGWTPHSCEPGCEPLKAAFWTLREHAARVCNSVGHGARTWGREDAGTQPCPESQTLTPIISSAHCVTLKKSPPPGPQKMGVFQVSAGREKGAGTWWAGSRQGLSTGCWALGRPQSIPFRQAFSQREEPGRAAGDREPETDENGAPYPDCPVSGGHSGGWTQPP